MKTIYSYLIAVLVALLGLTACTSSSFRVKGEITDAEGATLYLEQLSLPTTQTLEQVQLKKNGRFSFKAERPAEPDLYRLRLVREGVGEEHLMLAIDSTEHLTVTAEAGSLRAAEIDGSEKSLQLQSLRESLRTRSLDDHKQEAVRTILLDPKSTVAYYALFQQKGMQPVFDFFDPTDQKMFRAVATAWHAWYPESPRGKILYAQVLDGLNAQRHADHAQLMQQFMDEQENAFLDITLPDANDQQRSLSALRGKVFLLDFTSCQMPQYTGYVFEMKEIWNAFHGSGLEIYSVYPDANKLLWEDQVRALPWTCVRTPNGTNNSCYATYNVQQLPTIFLFDRKGEVLARVSSFDDLRTRLNTLLK